MPLDEKVLVIPESHFRAVGYFEGFHNAGESFTQQLLDAAVYSFRPRSEVETDPGYKQLIPYVVLTCDGLVFHYRRGSKGTETRLQSLRSIGIGGHISEADAAGDGDPYLNGLCRELEEEVEFREVVRRDLIGFIYDPSTAVGRVHLGIVHQFDLSEPFATVRDAALAEGSFAPLAQLRATQSEFETWSQFTLDRMAIQSRIREPEPKR